jgi:tetratricopeptide (TPR) repeat protein
MAAPPAGVDSKDAESTAFDQAIDTLVSPQASFAQRQDAWKRLRETGKLDQAITELEQRAAGDAGNAACPAALGQAYLQKCATIQDLPDQGILAMKADKAFTTALNLDPSNWDARFTKAVAMSYWPPQLNKGQEVIQNFETLVQQQEGQPPQPQFAQTYVWLGDQYQKAGRASDAQAIWQRGAALYPGDTTLPKRLAQPAGQ